MDENRQRPQQAPRQMPRRGPGGAVGPRPKLENPGRTFRRVIGFVAKHYLSEKLVHKIVL